MRYADVPGKDKTQVRMIEALSILEAMQELEGFNGTTKEKTVDNWYELKRRVHEAQNAEAPAKKEPEENE